MSDKPLIEEIREIMWKPPASHSEKEEITRLHTENAELRQSLADLGSVLDGEKHEHGEAIASLHNLLELADEERDLWKGNATRWRDERDKLRDEVTELRAQIAAHAKVGAERVGIAARLRRIAFDIEEQLDMCPPYFNDLDIGILRQLADWLDARLPGGGE